MVSILKRKILITGSSGMLCADLCKELSKDYVLIGLDMRELPDAGFQLSSFIRCDITDKSKTVESIVDARPDLIIHTASWTDVDGCEREPHKAKRVNGEGTGNVATAASRVGAVLVYISTDFVFDGKKTSPYTEEDKPHPLSVYGNSKLEGEWAVKKLLKKYFIIILIYKKEVYG